MRKLKTCDADLPVILERGRPRARGAANAPQSTRARFRGEFESGILAESLGHVTLVSLSSSTEASRERSDAANAPQRKGRVFAVYSSPEFFAKV